MNTLESANRCEAPNKIPYKHTILVGTDKKATTLDVQAFPLFYAYYGIIIGLFNNYTLNSRINSIEKSLKQENRVSENRLRTSELSSLYRFKKWTGV